MDDNSVYPPMTNALILSNFAHESEITRVV